MNNSAWKLPPPLIPQEIQRRDVAVPCPFTRFAIPPTDRSLAMLSSLAWSASKLLIRLVQTAVDPFTNRIVYQVTKISPARVANDLLSTNKPISSPSPLERFRFIFEFVNTFPVDFNWFIETMRSWQNLLRGPWELMSLFVNCRPLATLARLIFNSYTTYYAIGERVHGSLDEPS